MHEFLIKEIKNTDICTEIKKIGFDKAYALKGSEKFEYKNLKIYSLTPAQANILKQTAISCGCDCATHRDVITGKIELSDTVLSGSISQLKSIAQKLCFQPFGLKELGKNIEIFLNSLKINETKIVGILNVTENSFSDGGLYNDYESASKHIDEMISEGADIIDIGAESTKPYAYDVSSDKQLEKLIPIVKYAVKKSVVSIDTRNSDVAEECIKLGVSIINDVSGFDYDKKMPEIIAKYGVKVVIQHSKGTPQNMQDNPHYDNLIDEIYFALYNKINTALSFGIKKENIIIDPGIGFGKTAKDNFEIIKRIEEFKSLDCPVMAGISRKSFLGLQNETNLTKDIYTTALSTCLINGKTDYIRVHNVKFHKKLIEICKMFNSTPV